MEIWLDMSSEETVETEGVSRIWKGHSDDVAGIALDDYRGQEEAISLIGLAPWVLVKCSYWTMIPLENLVAASKGSGTRIAAAINHEIDLQGAAFALGHGVDAILVTSDLLNAALEVADTRHDTISTTENSMISYGSAQVISVENVGLGERVCIDLTQRLDDGEGMAIGSVSGVLCLVHGETVPSEYVPSRPFRVNAGAVHSYVLMADGATRYLSELSAGDEVAVLSNSGSKRSAVVGRLKIELRPLLIIRYRCGNSEGQLVTQQVETVRLVTPDGGKISVTEAIQEKEITVLLDNRMRHTGIALEGGITER